MRSTHSLTRSTLIAAVLLATACGAEGTDDLDDEIASSSDELTSVSIGNAGFESDWTGWTRVSPTGLTTVAHSGSTAAKLSGTTGQIKRVVYNLKPSTSYVVSAYVLGYGRVGVRNFGGSTTSKSVNAGSWTKLSVSFKTGSSNTSAEIFSSWVSGGDARVDDFSLAISSTTTTTSTSGCSYPSQIIDVGNWKLQLPIGDPTVEVKLPSLATYSNSPLFRTNSTCSGVRFRAPTNGTTTSGAQYPRTELREMTSDGSSTKSWSTTSGTHRMFIDQAVTALPKGKKSIAIGQIHNGTSELIIIRVEGSELFVKPAGYSAHVLDSNYTLGKRFKIELKAKDGTIYVYYNGSSSPVYSVKKSSSSAFFKAGAYPQSNCDTEADYGATCGSDDYGEVEIYDLWVQHS